MKCELRLATNDDCNFIYEMANDREVRMNSFNSEPIEYDSHVKWFSKKLLSSESEIYILLADGERAGQVRIDINEGVAIISYMISKDNRGKGLGSIMLQLLEEKAFMRNDVKCLLGEVKSGNAASVRVFEKLGYKSSFKEDIYTFIKEK